ncbi:MAG: hypothetical protein LBQ24_03950 [Candidatus Peribacteria bacterium]|jgi:hypothetical protein|nr:hypothetical protein [Candidatus Peribacteria bacterium]
MAAAFLAVPKGDGFSAYEAFCAILGLVRFIKENTRGPLPFRVSINKKTIDKEVLFSDDLNEVSFAHRRPENKKKKRKKKKK